MQHGYKVIQDLNRRFAAPLPESYQRRIIFWHDEDKEFEDKLDEMGLVSNPAMRKQERIIVLISMRKNVA